jgi:WD40 repeat protein
MGKRTAWFVVVVCASCGGAVQRPGGADEARDGGAAVLAERGRSALLAGEQPLAAVLMTAAYTRDPSPWVRLETARAVAIADAHVLSRPHATALALRDGHRVIVSRDGGADLVDLDRDGASVALDGVAALPGAVVTDDGRLFAPATGGGVGVWDLATGKRTASIAIAMPPTPPDEEPPWITVSHDGGLAAVVEAAHVIVVDVPSGKTLYTLDANADLRGYASFAPDGKTIVAGDASGVPAIRDARTGKVVRALAGAVAESAELGPDGRRVVSTGGDGGEWEPRMWDAATGALIVTWDGATSQGHGALAFTDDGARLLFYNRWDGWTEWDTSSGKELGSNSGYGVIAELSGDGRRVIDGGLYTTQGKQLAKPTVYDAATGGVIAVLDAGPEQAEGNVALDHDGGLAVVGDGDRAHIFDADTGGELADVQIGERSLQWLGDRYLLAEGQHDVDVWDLTRLGLPAVVHGAKQGIAGSPLTRDGARAVVGGDGDLTIVDVASGKHLATIAAAKTEDVVFDDAGDRLVTRTLLGNDAKIWDPRTGAAIATLSGPTSSIEAVRFSRDGARVVTSSYDKTARVWDAATGHLIATMAGDSGNITDPWFSPDGARVLANSYDETAHVWTARIWDAATGHVIVTLGDREDAVRSARFVGGGDVVLTGTAHGATTWDVATGKPLAHFQGEIRADGVSADGARLAGLGPDDRLEVWDLRTGEVVAMGERTTSSGATTISPDGSLVAHAGAAGVELYDAHSGAVLESLRGPPESADELVFSSDGGRLFAIGGGEVRIFDLHPEHRDPAALAALVGARVPLVLVGDRVLPARR